MDIDRLSQLFKSLQDTNRLRIIVLLSKRKLCVCEIAYVLGVTQPSISRHLKRLKELNLIVEEQDSFWTNYSLSTGDGVEWEVVKLTLDTLKDQKIILQDIDKLKSAHRSNICG